MDFQAPSKRLNFAIVSVFSQAILKITNAGIAISIPAIPQNPAQYLLLVHVAHPFGTWEYRLVGAEGNDRHQPHHRHCGAEHTRQSEPAEEHVHRMQDQRNEYRQHQRQQHRLHLVQHVAKHDNEQSDL